MRESRGHCCPRDRGIVGHVLLLDLAQGKPINSGRFRVAQFHTNGLDEIGEGGSASMPCLVAQARAGAGDTAGAPAVAGANALRGICAVSQSASTAEFFEKK